MEAWARKPYAVTVQHTLTLKEVHESLKTHWPIRVSRLISLSEEEAGSSPCNAAG